jgi:UDP-N-acetylglucosamine 1-carboxyvinyltransferase
MLAACVLTDEPVVLENVPRILDVDHMLRLLADLGVAVSRKGMPSNCARKGLKKTELDRACARKCAARSCWPGRCRRGTAAPRSSRPAAT